jgi:hypothetical protein
VLTLRVGAIVEVLTGIALLVVPSVVIDALIGSHSSSATLVGRVLGGALLSLGAAGTLAGRESPERAITVAFVVYNASTATILLIAGVAGEADGFLLWPVVAIHAGLATALVLEARQVPRREPPRAVA